MYVSKELALILEDKGFSKSFSSNSYYTTILSEEVIDWIFDEIGLESNPNTHIHYERKRLEFWYTTLLDHNFGLMHEFINRLEEWFESNGLFLDIKPTRVTVESGYITQYRVVIFDYRKNKSKLLYYDECNWHTFEDGDSDILETKRQAKHEAIMKCFELLNSDKDDAQ